MNTAERLAAAYDSRIARMPPRFCDPCITHTPPPAYPTARKSTIPADLTNDDRRNIREVRKAYRREMRRLGRIFGLGTPTQPQHVALTDIAASWGSFEALAEKFDTSVPAIREVVRRRWRDIRLPDER